MCVYSAWMKDTDDYIINHVSQKTKAFTNLTLDTVEELQVENSKQYEISPIESEETWFLIVLNGPLLVVNFDFLLIYILLNQQLF